MTAAVSADIELRNVSKLDFNAKNELLARGRPTPTLDTLLQQKGPTIVRSFQTDWYEKKDWLWLC